MNNDFHAKGGDIGVQMLLLLLSLLKKMACVQINLLNRIYKIVAKCLLMHGLFSP